MHEASMPILSPASRRSPGIMPSNSFIYRTGCLSMGSATKVDLSSLLSNSFNRCTVNSSTGSPVYKSSMPSSSTASREVASNFHNRCAEYSSTGSTMRKTSTSFLSKA